MKLSKGTIATLIFLGLIVYISWTMILTGAKYECEVCVKYNGKDQCQIVQGMEKEDTIMQGISTACGGVATGMTQSMDCQRTPPQQTVLPETLRRDHRPCGQSPQTRRYTS